MAALTWYTTVLLLLAVLMTSSVGKEQKLVRCVDECEGNGQYVGDPLGDWCKKRWFFEACKGVACKKTVWKGEFIHC